MMRSMYSAVSSLSAHQLRMDVIGNNIANVNTVGFKGSKAIFQEVFSQTLRGAGRPQENGRGGTNPQQIGLGASISSIDTFHIRGSVESTGYNTDLMINGEGFFVVSDTEEGLNKSYTRAGNFNVDGDGNLLTPDGYYVLGYRCDEEGNIIEELRGLKISRSETAPPMATDKTIFEGNIDSNLGADEDDKKTYKTIMRVYDSLGNSHSIELEFRRVNEDENEIGRTFEVSVVSIDGNDEIEGKPGIEISFDKDGKIIENENDNTFNLIVKDSDSGITIGKDSEDEDQNDNNFAGANALNIKLDFSKLTSYAAPSDAVALDINGYPSGKLEDFTISTTGEIEGVFSNGITRILGQLRLANFRNPSGLLKTGSNLYRETANSGEAMFGYPAVGGFASLQPGSLEMSNVDLSREFTDMITTQRGFQANSRVITTSDEMLQELVNMKR